MRELDERKTKILNAIIRNYLDTGEPVGSRTISKYSDLNLSSATIRNEMSDLEELGYILQPHTSAGRIPSDKGYRFYVDNLMKEKDQEVTEMKEFMIEHTERMEQVLKQMAKVLAANTNYTAMITAPSYQRNKVKFLQLSQVDEERPVVITGKAEHMVGKLPLHVCRLCLPLRTQLSVPSYNGKCEGGSSHRNMYSHCLFVPALYTKTHSHDFCHHCTLQKDIFTWPL